MFPYQIAKVVFLSKIPKNPTGLLNPVTNKFPVDEANVFI